MLLTECVKIIYLKIQLYLPGINELIFTGDYMQYYTVKELIILHTEARKNGQILTDNILSNAFHQMYFDSDLTEVCAYGSNSA